MTRSTNYRKTRCRKGGRARSSDINCNRLFYDTKEQKYQIHHPWSTIIRTFMFFCAVLHEAVKERNIRWTSRRDEGHSAVACRAFNRRPFVVRDIVHCPKHRRQHIWIQSGSFAEYPNASDKRATNAVYPSLIARVLKFDWKIDLSQLSPICKTDTRARWSFALDLILIDIDICEFFSP